MRARQRFGVAISVIGLATATAVIPTTVDAVDTDMTISTSAIDFGMVNVGSHWRADVGDADEHRRRPVRADQHLRRRTTDRRVQRLAELSRRHAPGRRIVHRELHVLAGHSGHVQRHVELHDQRDEQPSRRRGLQRHARRRRCRPHGDHDDLDEHDFHRRRRRPPRPLTTTTDDDD